MAPGVTVGFVTQVDSLSFVEPLLLHQFVGLAHEGDQRRPGHVLVIHCIVEHVEIEQLAHGVTPVTQPERTEQVVVDAATHFANPAYHIGHRSGIDDVFALQSPRGPRDPARLQRPPPLLERRALIRAVGQDQHRTVGLIHRDQGGLGQVGLKAVVRQSGRIHVRRTDPRPGTPK